MPTNRLPLAAILFIALILAFNTTTHAQSSANVTWTISPPNNPQGYISGETINICADISNVNFMDGSLVHGFVWNFPEGLDPFTFTISEQPLSCTDGTWNWYGAVTSNGSGLTYGPGFFYDEGQLADLNPGNNYGEQCPGTTYTICMEISIIENCNPDTNTDLTPTLSIYGDGTTGAWMSNTTDPITSQPSDMTLACCDANPGVSQEFVPICGSDPICLFDLISEGTSPSPNGIWVGPTGWSNVDECAPFEPNIDAPGTYSYTVIGTGGCFLTATVEMGYYNIDLGAVTHCQSTAIDLNEYLLPEGLPLSGIWYNPSGTPIPMGLIDPLSPGSQFGLFEYQFYDANACFTTANLELTLGPLVNPGVETNIDLCSQLETFCPFEYLLGNPSPNGQWTVYDEQGAFLTYLTSYNDCISLVEENTAYKFTYVLGVPPCTPSYTDLYINVMEGPQPPSNTIASVCANDSLIDLNSLLEGIDYTEWDWSEPSNGNAVSNPFDISIFPPGLTLQLQYSAGIGVCQVSGLLSIFILPDDADAGLNTTIEICETSPPFDMFNQLGGTPQPGGVWTNPMGMPMGGFFSSSVHPGGQYTYTVASTCGTDSATLTISVSNETPPLAAINTYAAICQDTGIVNLDTLLYGTDDYLGWEWTDENGTPLENPIDVSDFPPTGNIQLTYSGGVPPCQTTGDFTFYFSSPADTSETYIDICTSQGSLCLYDYVEGNPPTGGVWAEVDESGVYINFYQEYDVCLDISQMTGNTTFKYILGIPPCYPQWPLLNVNFLNAPGTANTAVTLCASQGEMILDSLINGNLPPNGQWTDPTGAFIDNTINTGTALSGTYTYTVDNGPCSGETLLTLTFEQPPNAGPDMTLNFCGDGSTIDLWTYTDPQSDAGGVFAPTNFITLLPINSGVYTYNVGGFVCPADFANYTINIEEELAISNLTESCNPTGTEYTVSFDITGGTLPYTIMGTSIPITVPTSPYAFTSLPIPAGSAYNFTISDLGLCQDISVSGLPDCQCETAYSTLTTANDSICEGTCTELVFQLEGDGPFNAVYSDGVSENSLNGINYGHIVTVCPNENTTYTLISVGGANCPLTPTANQTVPISVFTQPSAGPDVSLDFCPDFSLIDLYDYLHPLAPADGYFPTLYDTIVASTANSGDYTYYIDSNICESDSAIYTVNIFNPGNCTFESGGGGLGISLNPGEDDNGGRPVVSHPIQTPNQAIGPAWDFTLFPNPWSNQKPLQLVFQNLNTNSILTIHDMMGRLLWSEVLITSEHKNLPTLQSAPELESGTYLLTVTTEQGERKTKTMLISH